MSWLALSLLALFSFVLYDTAGRYLATRSRNPRAFAVIYNLSVTLMAPLVFLVDRTPPSSLTPQLWLFTVVGLTLWGIYGRLEYYYKKYVEASISAIVFKLATVLNFFLSLFFLREEFTVSKLLGVATIVVANSLLLVGNSRHSVISAKGLRYNLASILVIAIAWVFDTLNVRAWGVATFTLLSFLAPAIVSGIFPLIKLTELKTELRLTPIWQFFALGFFNLIGYAFMLKALTLNEASRVMPIVNSTAPYVVLLGVLLLHERDHLWRKVVAGILTILAIYFMR